MVYLFPGLCTGTLLCPEDSTLFMVAASNSASEDSMNTCARITPSTFGVQWLCKPSPFGDHDNQSLLSDVVS